MTDGKYGNAAFGPGEVTYAYRLHAQGLDGADHPETSILIVSQDLCRNDFVVVRRQIDALRLEDEMPNR